MGIFEGFPFVNKEERERRAREFNERVFPFGVETQREAVKGLLTELIPASPHKPDILLFAFIVAKDAYTAKGKGTQGIDAAHRALDRALRKGEREKALILAAVQADAEITTLDAYPTAEQVRAKAEHQIK
ncbi:MAG: hypothetical protein LBL63_01955 [Clostridiales Family XIII bacterium]|nr:hypothetical protein [Clostridiales Family XIII bacterium]